MWFVRDLNLFTLGFFFGGGVVRGRGEGGRWVVMEQQSRFSVAMKDLKFLFYPPFPE